jgi:glycosyltransferase involved in cell wall biosynthesis
VNLHEQGKLLYVSMVDVSQPGGPGVNEREFMVSLLRKFGPRVHVLIPRPAAPCSDVCAERTTFYRNPRRYDPLGWFRQQMQLRAEIHRLEAAEAFALIVIRIWILPLGLCLAGTSAPYVLKSLGAVHEFKKLPVGWARLLARLLGPLNDLLSRRVIQRALAIDTCTELLVDRNRRDFALPASRVLLCGNATNVDRFAPRRTEDARAALGMASWDPVLGFIGSRPTVRGAMTLLDVAARMVHDYPRLGVVIVGDEEGPLGKRAGELGLGGRVLTPGTVPYEDAPTYVNAFDVCFGFDRPQRVVETGNSYLKIRQYLACGKRTVTCLPADSPLVREGLVRNAGPADLDSIEKATRELLSWDDETISRHAARCAAYARRHLSTEVALDRRVDFWNKCLESAGPSPASLTGRPRGGKKSRAAA